jgi:hypothetical protein
LDVVAEAIVAVVGAVDPAVVAARTRIRSGV